MKKQLVIIGTLIASVLSIYLPSAHAAVPKKLNAFEEGERLVYTRLVGAYRANKRDEVFAQRALLEKNYPRSIHLDNAYYLSGMMDFQESRFAEAVRNFNVVRARFPKSNKRPAALFAMAMTYKKLGLEPQATRVMRMINKEYPGSPESMRTEMHLRSEKPRAMKR